MFFTTDDWFRLFDFDVFITQYVVVALWSNSWTWQSLFHCHVTALTHISVHVIKQCNVVLTNRQWCCAAGNVTPLLWGQQTFCTEIVHCFHGPSGVLFIRPYLVEHSSSLATALDHHWHSNSSSVCSRRHCLRDCHRTRLSDSSLLFVRFEVAVYYYYYYY